MCIPGVPYLDPVPDGVDLGVGVGAGVKGVADSHGVRDALHDGLKSDVLEGFLLVAFSKHSSIWPVSLRAVLRMMQRSRC